MPTRTVKPPERVYNRHLFSDKALKWLDGQIVVGLTESDWQQIYAFWDRQKALIPIFAAIDNPPTSQGPDTRGEGICTQ